MQNCFICLNSIDMHIACIEYCEHENFFNVKNDILHCLLHFNMYDIWFLKNKNLNKISIDVSTLKKNLFN